MNFSFESYGTNTYLVYTVSPDDTVDTMSLGMLTNNKIPGLAQAQFTQMDTTKYIKYNVSAHISVEQFFSGEVSRSRLLGVFNGIVDAMLAAEDYMIDVSTILLDMEYMFTDVSTCETILICLPVINKNGNSTDLGMFFKSIMFNTRFDQNDNCEYIPKLMNYLNSTAVFSLTDFKALLDEIDSPFKIETTQTDKVKPPVDRLEDHSGSEQGNIKKEQPKIETVEKKETKKDTQESRPVERLQTTEPANEKKVGNKGTEPEEKKISLLGLLMHYSKENLEIYKSQQAVKKKSGVLYKEDQIKRETFTAYGAPEVDDFGFDIPGQERTKRQSSFETQVQSQKLDQTKTTDDTNGYSNEKINVKEAKKEEGYSDSPNNKFHRQSMNFGETSTLGDGKIGETRVLNDKPDAVKQAPHLIRVKTGEKIAIDKPVFRIGKEKSYVDYFIGDNTAISRSHANIICRQGEYYVQDTNSTNHTYVNGVMSLSNVETKLSHGDIVRFANEDFEFKLF